MSGFLALHADAQLANEAIMPAQWRTGERVSDGMKKLCVALIEDALNLVNGKIDHWKDTLADVAAAEMWLGSASEALFSFRMCCRINDVDPDAAQDAMRNWKQPKRITRAYERAAKTALSLSEG